MLTLYLLAYLCAAAPASPVQIRSTADPLQVEVAAVLPERLRQQLPQGKLTQEQGERWLRFVLVDLETGRAGTPILGTYERRETTLVFRPRFALTHGQRYRAVFEPVRGDSAAAEYRAPPRPATLPAVVERIYPSSAVLPANQLKFYIHFSQAMREDGLIFERIRILDADGKPVEDPWRRTELWSVDRKRLTLWIHPGRIKIGVNLREEFGPVLHPDRDYTLQIGAELRDAEGQPLGQAFTKKFRAAAEERSRPLPEQWKVRPPMANSRQPLIVEFPRPLDRALLDRFLTVKDDAGKPVAGRIEVGSAEKSWLFHPERPWLPLGYTLAVDERLEDLAGNTPVRLFDVPPGEPTPAPPRLTLRFEPRP